MIDVKETIDSAGISQYRFAKLVDRAKTQVYRWYTLGVQPSTLMESHIRAVCKREGIDIVEKTIDSTS